MSLVIGLSGFHITSVIWKLVPINQALSEGVPFFYDRTGFPGSPGSYGPPNHKNANFLVFFEFLSDKKLPNVFILLHNKNLHVHSFSTIPSLPGLDRGFKSYGPGSDSEKSKTRKL